MAIYGKKFSKILNLAIQTFNLILDIPAEIDYIYQHRKSELFFIS